MHLPFDCPVSVIVGRTVSIPRLHASSGQPNSEAVGVERDIPGNIVDFIGHHKRIFPIGRLDKPSDGLIFLTNDGDIVNKILRAGNNHEKEYVVRVDKPITTEFLKQMGAGVHILDTVTLPCKVEKETKFSFRITLTQGLNRQIRRMCEALGYEVFKLRRVRIMNISLDGIPNGKWRYLSDEEITEILAMCEGSVSTEDASKMNAKGQRIRKATDAKLFDSREENQTSTARRNQKENRTRTYRGNNADEFRHAPNSKRGRNSSNGESGGNTENWKSNSRSERSNSDRNRSDRNRNDRDNTDRRSGKPANRSQNSNRPNKPAPKRVGGTLGLKK